MANTKSAAKRARQTVKRTARNRSVLTGLKSAQKKLATEITSKDKKAVETAFRDYVSELDKAAKRGVIHRNTRDRRKSKGALLVARSK